ncbi:hypothetical protein XFLAVUS301_35340 [Xanthobacter flavus]|uniref:Uncharacterized protein n=1 Tax=Xanthobacter flavus TaxID=281 RepID=A0A9W6CNY1_XANFL|nr:hypothetical protein XFLAVUS301_35340 [Xanthobacter flavus]
MLWVPPADSGVASGVAPDGCSGPPAPAAGTFSPPATRTPLIQNMDLIYLANWDRRRATSEGTIICLRNAHKRASMGGGKRGPYIGPKETSGAGPEPVGAPRNGRKEEHR